MGQGRKLGSSPSLCLLYAPHPHPDMNQLVFLGLEEMGSGNAGAHFLQSLPFLFPQGLAPRLQQHKQKQQRSLVSTPGAPACWLPSPPASPCYYHWRA